MGPTNENMLPQKSKKRIEKLLNLLLRVIQVNVFGSNLIQFLNADLVAHSL